MLVDVVDPILRVASSMKMAHDFHSSSWLKQSIMRTTGPALVVYQHSTETLPSN
jgi:hypothetical protein